MTVRSPSSSVARPASGLKTHSILRAVVFAVGLSASATAMAQDKVVLQISEADPARSNLVFNNARNLRNGLGPDADLEIVVFGPGIQMLKADSPVAQLVAEAAGNHIKVVGCEVSMAGAKLTKTDMLHDIGFVPSGVVEVTRKQQQGYAYIRP